MSRISRNAIIFAGFGLAVLAGPVACERVPLLAPTGTVINLTLASDVAALNSSVDVIAVLIENGGAAGTGTGTASSTTGAGTPVQNGTVVSFTTNIGTIEPAEAKTQNGRVNVKLMTNGQSGKATITAYSGGAKSTAQITIGAAAVDHITTTAAPANLGANGGTSTISARVADTSDNGLAGIQVQFTTTKGTLSAAAATTNSSGVATTTLSTTAAADVTATIGAKSSKVTVTVASRGSLTVSMTAPTGGSVAKTVPASFSVDAGSGAGAVQLSNITIEYGDGSSAPLGAFTGARSVVHCYSSSGIKDVRASGTDPDGLTVSSSTQVAVTSLAATLSSGGAVVNTSITFLATVTPASTPAPQIGSYDWEWNTGEGFTTTSTGPSQTHVYTTIGRKTVTVRVNPGCGAGSFTVSMEIQIS